MYTKYAESQGWRCEIIDANEPELGGFKEVVFSVDGENVYSKMKFESGVHRVQRVPATETQGRVHTSTVTVAVLPEMEDVDIEVNEKDLKSTLTVRVVQVVSISIKLSLPFVLLTYHLVLL